MDAIFDKSEIYGGETIAVSATVPDGTAAAEVRLTGGASVPLTITDTTAAGVITSAVTLALPSFCRWGLFATGEDGSVSCLYRGSLAVNKLTSDYRAALAAVDAAIASYGSNPNRSITVGEISIHYKSLDDLLALRSYYAGLVAADEGGEPAFSGKFATIVDTFGGFR